MSQTMKRDLAESQACQCDHCRALRREVAEGFGDDDFTRFWASMKSPDRDIIRTVLGGSERAPDVIIEPNGRPYIYRWHVLPRRVIGANVYLHVQVADDDDRGLHDHPWDNTSVILAGGYIEELSDGDFWGGRPAQPRIYERKPGDVIFRRAKDAHRLRLPEGVPYSISLFTTGPVLREWGFWVGAEWQAAIVNEKGLAIRD